MLRLHRSCQRALSLIGPSNLLLVAPTSPPQAIREAEAAAAAAAAEAEAAAAAAEADAAEAEYQVAAAAASAPALPASQAAGVLDALRRSPLMLDLPASHPGLAAIASMVGTAPGNLVQP
jgi:hypothetical protein